MKQQINLYRDGLRPSKVPLSAATVAGLAVLGLVVIGCGYGYLQWKTSTVQQRAEALQTRRDSLAARVEALGEQVSQQQPDPGLKAEAVRLERELRLKRDLMGVVSGGGNANTDGFSVLLEGLGRRRLVGIWLQQVAVRSGGSEMAIRGKTRKPGLVPDYLQALSNEPAYVGKSFQTFRLQRPDGKNGEPYGFVIATHCDGAKKPLENAAACLEESR
jgi:MSHA biogenesis protein MshI